MNTVCMFFLCANKETAVSAASKEVARGGGSPVWNTRTMVGPKGGGSAFQVYTHSRERVLFIGTQFSILYTSMYSPAEAATLKCS